MSRESLATVTSKGQITVPAEVRRHWQLKPGDQIVFRLLTETEAAIAPRRKRSIFERLEELKLPALGRELLDGEIEAAIAENVNEEFGSTQK